MLEFGDVKRKWGHTIQNALLDLGVLACLEGERYYFSQEPAPETPPERCYRLPLFMELLRRYLGLIFRVFVSVLLIDCVIQWIDWSQLWYCLRTMQVGWLIAGFLCSGPVLVIISWRWQLLLRSQGVRFRFWKILELTMIGQFFSAFLVGTTGGDMVKIFYVTRAVPQRKVAVSFTVIVDRVIGLVSLLLFGVALSVTQLDRLLANPGAKAATVTFYVFALVGITASLLACLTPFLPENQAFRTFLKRIPLLHYGTALFAVYEQTARAVGINFAALIGSIAAHMWTTLRGYCILRSMHLDPAPPLLAFCSTLVIVNVLIALPVSVSGLGLRETLFIMFFAVLNLDKEHALAFSITYFGFNMLWSLLGSPIYFLYRHELQAAEPAPVKSVHIFPQ